MKTCTRCGLETDNFAKRKVSKDGLNARCKDCISEISASHYLKNRNKIIKQASVYVQNNREANRSWRRSYKAVKRVEDMQWKLKERGRKRRYDALKNKKADKQGVYLDVIGCTIEFFHNWIESQFLPGMTWQNWGPIWQIDEIIPCEAFDLTDPAEDRLCWHYTNSRPLWSSENQSRGGLWCEEVKQKYRVEIEKLLTLPVDAELHWSLRQIKTQVPTPKNVVPVKEYRARVTLTAEQENEIVSQFVSGLKAKDIGKTFGISKSSVHYIVKKAGASHPPQKYDESHIMNVKTLRLRGKTIKEISVLTSLSENTVDYLLRSNGILLPPEFINLDKKKWSPEDRTKILELRKKGITMKEISALLNMPVGTVKRMSVGL